MQEIIFTIDQLPSVVHTIMQKAKHVQVMTLQGTLGAGKTTFAIELLKAYGVQSEMQSPTYTYVQMYQNAQGKHFYHFDLYRLQDKNAFLFAGFDDFLYQPHSLALIEWPEIIQDIVQENVCALELEYIDSSTRKIKWKITPALDE
jgi:tRNA threonylcarbamoyladenosine biosynthesis protein TsaE